MNKETKQLFDYLEQSGYYLGRIKMLQDKFNNIKDFTLMMNYVIMEIVSEEKKFINMPRKNIELPELAQLYFEKEIK